MTANFFYTGYITGVSSYSAIINRIKTTFIDGYHYQVVKQMPENIYSNITYITDITFTAIYIQKGTCAILVNCTIRK